MKAFPPSRYRASLRLSRFVAAVDFRRHPQRTTAALLVAGLAVWLGSARVAAQEQSQRPSPAGILFVHLRASPSGFELVDTRLTGGVLKTPHYDRGRSELHFELVDNNALVLFRNSCAEPTVQRLEYEDPAQPGRILSRQIVSPTAEFTIRVPYFASAHKIRFYRPQGSRTAGTASQELVASGEVTLPLNR